MVLLVLLPHNAATDLGVIGYDFHQPYAAGTDVQYSFPLFQGN